ncbi:hypothetical protein DFH07DRAFT_959883 [Mycena maculata]|uniref:Uncharacterized protein n=1 Tax=Mycena maculata TaxID=230809 RepID=A0AAD7NC83_9AGAR|nr:hypothetical protein DFH07DRAFT_959883 [Mycena maculata]
MSSIHVAAQTLGMMTALLYASPVFITTRVCVGLERAGVPVTMQALRTPASEENGETEGKEE